MTFWERFLDFAEFMARRLIFLWFVLSTIFLASLEDGAKAYSFVSDSFWLSAFALGVSVLVLKKPKKEDS